LFQLAEIDFAVGIKRRGNGRKDSVQEHEVPQK
jgi:hypothetical protein